ncbi:MAG: tetratricopeptide repeat protein, partial [Planctomycetota bacterium]
LAHMGQDAHALSTLRSVSSSAEAYTSLAYVYSQKGDRQQAEEYFHRAIDEDDGYAPASEALLQLAKAERGQSAGSNRQLPDGITVVSVRPVNESLRAAHYAGHSLSDVASGAVRPAGVFEVALAESAGGTSSGSEDHIARASVPQESVSDSLIKTVSHAEPAKVHAVTDLQRRADGDSPGKAEMDSLLTVLKYGGAEAQVTAIYDLLHLKLIDRRAATALRDLSQSGNLQVREAAKDALQATGLNDE